MAPRVFCTIIAHALLRGDAKNIPAMMSTGMAINRPMNGMIIIPIKVKNMPMTKSKKPTVTLDTRSNLQSVLFILHSHDDDYVDFTPI
jgi:hypothetical protein